MDSYLQFTAFSMYAMMHGRQNSCLQGSYSRVYGCKQIKHFIIN